MIPYLNGPAEPLYDHCKRAIERSFSRFSPRGIPLMGDHDWNDGLSAVGTLLKGESFWVAEFLYMILGNFIPLARRRGDERFARRCEVVRESLKEALNRHGWDGEWYLQATTDDGLLLGSHENEEGKIFLMPNIWAVISGAAEDERAQTAMASVTQYLLKDYGTLLNFPAFTHPRPDIGYVTRYAPGLRENGGVYTHAATWSVWAYALVGQPELAYEAYRRICPPNRSADIDTYKAEPYVTPGNIDGPLSEYYGRGGWTWYTGSAQWLHRVATHWILGIRPQEDGLLVEPSIPARWPGFKVTRKFRRRSVRNRGRKSRSTSTAEFAPSWLTGNLIRSNLLPVFADGKTHAVQDRHGGLGPERRLPEQTDTSRFCRQEQMRSRLHASRCIHHAHRHKEMMEDEALSQTYDRGLRPRHRPGGLRAGSPRARPGRGHHSLCQLEPWHRRRKQPPTPARRRLHGSTPRTSRLNSWTCPATDGWDEKLTNYAARGELPDVFMANNTPLYVKNGWVADLTALVAERCRLGRMCRRC